jgi:hypothetical protein
MSGGMERAGEMPALTQLAATANAKDDPSNIADIVEILVTTGRWSHQALDV